MPEKRPYPADGIENGDSKRTRSNNGSPAATNTNGSHMTAMSDMDRKKAEAAERIAALKAKMAAQRPAAPAVGTTTTATPTAVNDITAKIAAMKAKVNAGRGAVSSPAPQSPSPAPTSQAPMSDIARQAEARAKIAAMRDKVTPRYQGNPRMAAPTPPVREDNGARARGGLGVGLHPSLLEDLRPSSNAKGPSGRQKEAAGKARANPYLSQEAAVAEEERNGPNFDAGLSKQRDRKSRQLVFNQKGKFMAQAEALRAQDRLEKMKRAIQEQARKANIEQATEKSFLVAAPPNIEWWDEGLVNGENYDDIDSPGKLNFDLITQYVQHPVLLDPPQEKLAPPPKAMYLTKEEMKKLRRQKRMADHKDEQTKIRLGLVPAPAPKVKKGNLMRVLGQEAVKDPTAVEARVNREIAQREADHEAANEERQLTKEQRHEKLAAQQEADAAKGVKVSVYKIDNLSYQQHRYKIDVNAKQNALTGITILSPKMNLVIVEGGAHSINFYRKLMMNRIRWTENAPPSSVSDRNREAEQEWLKGLDEKGQLKDLSLNKCTLVWEGEERGRAFKRWTTKACETDGEAKDVLSRNKMENMWTLAQSMP